MSALEPALAAAPHLRVFGARVRLRARSHAQAGGNATRCAVDAAELRAADGQVSGNRGALWRALPLEWPASADAAAGALPPALVFGGALDAWDVPQRVWQAGGADVVSLELDMLAAVFAADGSLAPHAPSTNRVVCEIAAAQLDLFYGAGDPVRWRAPPTQMLRAKLSPWVVYDPRGPQNGTSLTRAPPPNDANGHAWYEDEYVIEEAQWNRGRGPFGCVARTHGRASRLCSPLAQLRHGRRLDVQDQHRGAAHAANGLLSHRVYGRL